MQIDVSQKNKKNGCACQKCDILEKRVKALEDLVKSFAKIVNPSDETAPVINGKATFQTLQMGSRYMISTDGLILTLDLVEKQKGNIITLKKGIEIDFLTIHIF
jgi:hypothetical protein